MSALHPWLRQQTNWREETKNNCSERLLRKETRTLMIMNMEPLPPLRINFSELEKTHFQPRFIFFFLKIKTLSNVYRLFLSRQEHQKLQLDIIHGWSEIHHGTGILSGAHCSLTSSEGLTPCPTQLIQPLCGDRGLKLLFAPLLLFSS